MKRLGILFSTCIAHHLFINIGDIPCKSSLLLLVSRHQNGTDIAITDGKGQVTNVNVKGHFLPADCEQKESCRDLTVLNRLSHQYVAFVPGISSVLILDIRLVGQIVSINDVYRKDLPASAGCSEIGIFVLRESVFVSCLNSAEGYLAFMLLRLNASNIEGSTISAPVTTFFGVQDQIISNFVTVAFGSNPDAQQIYFQTGPNLYYCTPLSHSCNLDPIAILPNCPRPYRLAYPSGNTMMLYCEEAFVVYVDIQEGAVLNVSSNAKFGRPYVCTDRNVRLRRLVVVFKADSNYVQYGIWSQGGGVKNVTLRGQNFDMGVCVIANERTLFIYVDKVDGVYATDLVSETTRLLVDGVCLSNSSFHPLSIVEDHLVVQGAGCGHVSLFDLNTRNVTRIFEVEYSAEAATELVLTAQGDANCSVGQPVYHEGWRLSSSSVTWMCAGAVVTLASIVAVLIIVFFLYCSKR